MLLLPLATGTPLTLPYRELRVPLAQLFNIPSTLVGEASASLSLANESVGDSSPEKEAGASCWSRVAAVQSTENLRSLSLRHDH